MRSLPYTYLAKQKYWRFRHPEIGEHSLDGKPFDRDYINHYRALLARVGLNFQSVGADKILRSHEAQAQYTRLYFMAIEPDGPIKIGITYDIPRRLRHIQAACPYEVTLLGDVPGTLAMERALQRHFKASRMKGEWFHRTPELTAEIASILGENNA